MKIALDYDETFTADRDLWIQVVRLMKMRGHEVAFVTFRQAGPHNTDIMVDAGFLDIPIIFCAGRQKSHCYEADIWIDDMPELIPSFGQLSAIRDGCIGMGDKQ